MLEYIYRHRIETDLDVGRIILFDHFYTGAAALGDLADIRSFHQTEANIGMAETSVGARFARANIRQALNVSRVPNCAKMCN